MYRINCNNSFSFKINGSRFDSFSFYITNLEEINNVINSISIQYPKANHICYAYAYICNNQINYGCYESTEPKNSSGKQLLYLIQNKNLVNILIISVRTMSGSKLGIGLLTRSYLKSGKELLNDDMLIKYVPSYIKTFIIDIKDLQQFIFKMNNLNNKIISKEFNDNKVKLEVEIFEKL